MPGSWYDTGFDGMDEEQRRLDDMQGPGRLWIPATQSKDTVWVDDAPVCIHEHNPKMNGNYRNWITCLQGVHDEVVCCAKLGPSSRYYVGYLTSVDCSEWQDQRGNKHQYEMRLVPLKLRSLKKFRRKVEDRGKMIGTMWRLTREDDKSPTCGDDWEFLRDVDMAKMFEFANYRGKRLEEMWAEAERDAEAMARVTRTFQIKPGEDGKLPREVPPFNYFEILKPKPPKELRMLLGAVEADDSKGVPAAAGAGAGAAKADPIPF